MKRPQIHGSGRLFTASNILGTAGVSLRDIKKADRLTHVQMGEAMAGRSDDRAAAYIAGTADMGIVPFMFAARQWGERFLDPILALVGMRAVSIDAACDTDTGSGRRTASVTARLLAKLSAALEDDGVVDDSEAVEMEAELEDARRHIEAKLARIRKIKLTAVAAA